MYSVTLLLTQKKIEQPESLYCVCRQKDDGTFMICCDECSDWFHGKCVGILERDAKFVDNFVCPNCTAAGKGFYLFNQLFF